MPYCRFFKVNSETNWAILNNSAQLHAFNQRKMLKYKVLITINVTSNEFDNICREINLPNEIYRKFTSMSIAGSDGIWSCIVICDQSRNYKLIIYTAGQSAPLYVGVE